MPGPQKQYPETIKARTPRGTKAWLRAYARSRSFRRPDGEPDSSAAIRELLSLGRQVAERMAAKGGQAE